MRVGSFEVDIVAGEGVRGAFPANGQGQVAVPHKTYYGVRMRTYIRKRCEVELFIEGESVGLWNLSPMEDDVLYRGAHSSDGFLFVALGTDEARQGALVDDDKIGLVQAVFRPEVDKWIPAVSKSFEPEVTRGGGYSGEAKGITTRGGGTVYGDAVSQTFGTAAKLTTEPLEVVTVSLRLIVADAPSIRPVRRSNPIPPKA